MRLLAAGVVVAGAALLAVPLLAVRSSSNRDGLSDAGVDGGFAPASNGGVLPATRDAGTRIEIKQDGTQVIHVGDPIGVLHSSPDARSDAGTVAGGPTVSELQAQISTLQAQQLALQQRQSTAADQAQTLQQMNDQLQQLNAQMASRQAQRDQTSADNLQRQQQTQHAIDGLGTALDAMASGNDDVGPALDAADQSFTPQARRDLAAARDAIANKNLDQARALLRTAMRDAQSGR